MVRTRTLASVFGAALLALGCEQDPYERLADCQALLDEGHDCVRCKPDPGGAFRFNDFVCPAHDCIERAAERWDGERRKQHDACRFLLRDFYARTAPPAS